MIIRHLHTIDQFVEQNKNSHSFQNYINGLLKKAIFFAQNLDSQSHRHQGKVISSIFLEPSTRTDISFKFAAHKLGINVLDLNADSSSLTKGESFEDTVQTLEAMGIRAAIVRSKDETLIQKHMNNRQLSFINAGSGTHSHPSQALLDLLTIKTEMKRVNNLRITIVGDVKHSRVAASHLRLHKELGNQVFTCGPDIFHLEGTKNISYEKAISDSDVIILLRIQFERHTDIHISKDEYHQQYGLTSTKIKKLNPNAIIMHPGPFNLGVEISKDVLSHPQVKILKQVQNSIPMRMAIIDTLLKGDL